MSPPAVSFVAPSAYPLGGVATWLDQVVPALRRMGWDAEVVLADGRLHDARAYVRAHPAIAPARPVRAPTGTPEGRVHALAGALRARAPRTVVSVNIPDALRAVARLAAAGEDAGLRAVMSIHGLEPDLFADAALLAPALDGVVCTNRLARAHAAQICGVPPERVLYAPYGTPLPEPAAPRAGAPLVVGFAGRFERFQKRVQDLAPLARALAGHGVHAHWLVAGDGPDRADVDALAAACPGAVELLGHVDAAQMAARFYARCDVLLNPSAWETGPIVVWEAMARGVAVVSSRYVGSGREGALRDGVNCLLYDTGDVDAAARCVQHAASPALRARLCAAARELVAARYSPDASARAWSDALAALAALPPRHGALAPPAGAGRLDRWLGRARAERVRRVLGRRYPHLDPGGEWPHTCSATARDDAAHWAALRALDAAGEPAPER